MNILSLNHFCRIIPSIKKIFMRNIFVFSYCIIINLVELFILIDTKINLKYIKSSLIFF